jgi:quinol monooxygenase YgiN
MPYPCVLSPRPADVDANTPTPGARLVAVENPRVAARKILESWLSPMSPSPITLVVVFQARPGQESALRAILTGLVAPTRVEAGCINYDLHSAPDDPAKFLIYENWASPDHHRAHDQTPHVQHLRAHLPELSLPLAKSFWQKMD